MNYNLPNKTMNAASSDIRSAFERAAKIEGCISFGIGNPANEAIPTDVILKSINEIIKKDPMLILKYGPTNGFQPLIDLTVEHLVSNKNLPREDNSLILLNGSGHGLGLFPRAVCTEGDIVFAEEFTFPNGVNAPMAVGCTIKGIKMDEFGMIPSELEKEARLGGGKYIYTIPTFQNPTGRTIPLNRRKEIYEIAKKYDLLIYEDDPYGEIRFAGEEVPSFKSIDVDGRVVFAGSYSKVMSAGIRVGYLYGNTFLMQKLNALKASSDGQLPLLNQLIVYNSLKSIDYAPYIQNICDIYGRKCKIMVDSLKKYCSDKFTFIEPEGGMFLWLDMPDGVNGDEFFEKCLEHKVCVIHSSGFLASGKTSKINAFRLNYTAISDEDIIEGVKRLGEVTKLYDK